MNKEIQHHGAQDKGFRPPHTISNKQTGGDKKGNVITAGSKYLTTEALK